MLRSAPLLAIMAFLALAAAVPAAEITDATGRTVEVPAPASRVFIAGPPAAVLVYVLKPEALLGWSHGLRDSDRTMLPAPARDLPQLPDLTGSDGAPNLAGLEAAAPDLVVDYGTVRQNYIAQAEAVQAASAIPTVLFDGDLDAIPATLRTLGAALGVAERAEELAARAEAILAGVDATLARVPPEARPRVYLARGADGLQSGGPGSINAAIIARAGAVNVVDTGEGRNLVDVTPAEIAAWAPDVVVTLNPQFAADATTRPEWRDLPAVAEGRLLLAPASPFGFLDSPPSVNRLIGLRWLMHQLYPDVAEGDLRAEVQDFYRLYYGIDLDEAALAHLLGS